MTESMFEDQARPASRSAKDDFGLTPADVTARRPLAQSGVRDLEGASPYLRSNPPAGALDIDLGDPFFSQRRVAGVWGQLQKEGEEQRQAQAAKAQVYGAMGDGAFLDMNSGRTAAEQVRIAQEADDRLDPDSARLRFGHTAPDTRRAGSGPDVWKAGELNKYSRATQMNMLGDAVMASSGEQRAHLQTQMADMYRRRQADDAADAHRQRHVRAFLRFGQAQGRAQGAEQAQAPLDEAAHKCPLVGWKRSSQLEHVGPRMGPTSRRNCKGRDP